MNRFCSAVSDFLNIQCHRWFFPLDIANLFFLTFFKTDFTFNFFSVPDYLFLLMWQFQVWIIPIENVFCIFVCMQIKLIYLVKIKLLKKTYIIFKAVSIQYQFFFLIIVLVSSCWASKKWQKFWLVLKLL